MSYRLTRVDINVRKEFVSGVSRQGHANVDSMLSQVIVLTITAARTDRYGLC